MYVNGANSVVDQQDNNNIGTQASSTLLWSSVGANNQSNNIVDEQLPLNISSDPFFEVAAEGNGFKVYSSPVIFKGADNNIYDCCGQKSVSLKALDILTMQDLSTADASFNVSLTPASEFKTYQVILSKEDGMYSFMFLIKMVLISTAQLVLSS